MAKPGSPKSSELAAKGPDLTRRDWLIGGQKLLKEDGLRALKLRRLAADLGVSTGSFYHHFNSFDAYQGLLAEFFSGEQIGEVLRATEKVTTPLGRIRALVEIVEAERLTELSLAMRAWAEGDERARTSVRLHDSAVLTFLTTNLELVGFDNGQSRLRAYALVAVGLGRVHADTGLTGGELRDGLLALLCSR
jgi:AcrR family transcriptional regulator